VFRQQPSNVACLLPVRFPYRGLKVSDAAHRELAAQMFSREILTPFPVTDQHISDDEDH
jgi:hypothetical protein